MNEDVTPGEIETADRIRLSYTKDGMTDIVVYPGLNFMPIFGFAVLDAGNYRNSPPVKDLLTNQRRAIILKNINGYRANGCRFRTVLVG